MDFDYPVFKELAHNDTGAAVGHQGGIVIPKDLQDYFPDLSEKLSSGSPTADQLLEAELFLNGAYKGNVTTRYQYQTWSGTRSPERRITGELGAIRNEAVAGDFVLFQRSLTELGKFRISLITRGSEQFAYIVSAAASRRWGVLDEAELPVSNKDVSDALAEVEKQESVEFALFTDGVDTVESHIKRVARDLAFRKRVLVTYSNKCAITGETILSPTGLIGLDAAHVVPVHRQGTNDVRNGLCLSKGLHWAFDHGLISLSEDLHVIVPEEVKSMPGNKELSELHGSSLRLPTDKSLSVNLLAAKWHREHIMFKAQS